MIRTRALLLLPFCLGLLLPAASFAKQAKSTGHYAEWISFDDAAKTVTVKIKGRGQGPNKKALKKNKEVTFRVVPTGSILKRTSVAVNGQKGEITDIDAGRAVMIYWIPDPENKDGYFARKIDVVLSEEEFNKRYTEE